MLLERMISRASPRVAEGASVIGSWMTPLALRLTLTTWVTWSSMDRLRWMTPIPPSRARATASRHSVTVSMADELKGTFSDTRRLKRVASVTSLGSTSECRGVSRTSSNVRARGISDMARGGREVPRQLPLSWAWGEAPRGSPRGPHGGWNPRSLSSEVARIHARGPLPRCSRGPKPRGAVQWLRA